MRDRLTFRDRCVFLARRVLSNLPELGVVAKPKHHKEGISAVVPVKNEARWIKPCILSFVNYVDEVIVVDSSSDETPAIVQSTADSNWKVKHIQFCCGKQNAIAIARQIGLETASYKWILMLDADMVAKDITVWINRLKSLNPNKYYCIDLGRVNIEGDIYHQSKGLPFGSYAARFFTWSPDLQYMMKTYVEPRMHGWERFVTNPQEDLKTATKGYEQVSTSYNGRCSKRFPLYYELRRWTEPLIYHFNIKSPKQILTRMFWEEYMGSSDKNLTLEQYAQHRVTEDWHMTMDEAEDKIISMMKDSLAPYDKNRFGELPELVKNEK